MPWEKKGVTGGKLLIGPYLNHHTGQQAGVPLLTFCRQVFRPSTRTSSVILHLSILRLNQRLTILLVKKLKRNFELDANNSMFYAIEHLQHIKVILQNKLTVHRSEISPQLIECFNTPECSQMQVMQYSERLERLIFMKERANGLLYRSCYEETAHNVVNAQSEGTSMSHSARSKPALKWHVSWDNTTAKTPEIRRRVNSLEQLSRARVRASKPSLHLPSNQQSRKLGLILSLRRKWHI